MKTHFKFYEYYKNKRGNTFSIPLIYVKGKIKVWEVKVIRAIPPNKVRDNVDRAFARSILWLWRKKK